jgi:hypothetical protein
MGRIVHGFGGDPTGGGRFNEIAILGEGGIGRVFAW